jgi:hypothetical protein
MAEENYKPAMIAIHSDEEGLLQSFRELADTTIQVGNLQKTRRVEDAKLEPWAVAQMAYQVVGVIGSVGGAVRFVDWVLEKLGKLRTAKSSPATFRLEIGGLKIEVSGASVPDDVRRKLEKALEVPPQ